MAAIRSISGLLGVRSLRRIATRGYADEMSFTFAAGNNVIFSIPFVCISFMYFLIFQVFYDSASVRQVDVPSFSGSFGILPKHVPTLAVLKPGVVTVFENDGAVKKIFVSSGTVTINEDSSVQVCSNFLCFICQKNLYFFLR